MLLLAISAGDPRRRSVDIGGEEKGECGQRARRLSRSRTDKAEDAVD
jgi:hypothetical protein